MSHPAGRWMQRVWAATLAAVGVIALSGVPNALGQPLPGRTPGAPGPRPAARAGFSGGRLSDGPAGRPAAADARTAAPIDLTGYWVSLITEDWRFRMVIPAKGDYDGVPLNLAAKLIADHWNPATAEAAGRQCEAYGAGAVMLVPERLHILWQDANTLVVDTDSGMQTRVLHFKPEVPDVAPARSWQGYSTARWDLHESQTGFRGGGGVVDVVPPKPPPPRGSLEIHTSDLLPGLIRKNGIPYSDKARLTEYWEVNQDEGDRLLTVTSELTDPQYLEAPYVTNAIFQKQADGSGWAPSPCTLRR